MTFMLLPPAWASDPGIPITPPPEKPILVDPTGAAIPPQRGCAPVIFVTFPQAPPDATNINGLHHTFRWDGHACHGWGTDAIQGRIASELLVALNTDGTAATGETAAAPVVSFTELPPAIHAQLEQAIQRIEIAATPPAEDAAPPPVAAWTGWGFALLLVAGAVAAAFFTRPRKQS